MITPFYEQTIHSNRDVLSMLNKIGVSIVHHLAAHGGDASAHRTFLESLSDEVGRAIDAWVARHPELKRDPAFDDLSIKNERIVVCSRCGALYDIHYIDEVKLNGPKIVQFECMNCGMVPVTWKNLKHFGSEV